MEKTKKKVSLATIFVAVMVCLVAAFIGLILGIAIS